MTNEEKLKLRLSSIAQIMKEWSEEGYKSSEAHKDFNSELSQWFKGKSDAYKMAADWILETLNLGE